MKRFILAISIALFTAPALAEGPSVGFLTVTITDVGKPYSVIDGGCAYGKAGGFDVMSPEFESAYLAGAQRLVGIAKAHGADAIVGMHVVPISETAGDRNGVLVCGTYVKIK